MKKPENWYGFMMVTCELHDSGQSNMKAWSQQQYCARKDRQGKDRPYWENDVCHERLKCHWNVCPKLKKQRKAGNFKGWDIMGKEIKP